jgi:hypothetical protein
MFIRKPRSEKTTLSLIDICNKEHVFHKLITIENFFLDNTHNEKFTVKAFIKEQGKYKNYYFYIFTTDKGCVCYCEFIDNSICRTIYKLNNYKYIFEPHSDTHPDFQRFGLASNIYVYFLLNVSEAVLVTSKHTKLASYLWKSVCSKIKAKTIYHSLITGLQENKPTKSNLKLLVKNVK